MQFSLLIGFSDPFCEVKVGGERKFTTSIKKKTLTPVWDEWVTLQLPKPEETLEIVSFKIIYVFDRILKMSKVYNKPKELFYALKNEV